jgi:hypothetical protein
MGDSNLGTWKLNLAKSKYELGLPPRSETTIIEAWESDGVTVSATRVLADGTSLTGGFSAHYDGKDYSVAGLPDIETIAYNRVDANTLAFTLKHGEVVVGTGNAVVSNNGTMRTTTVTATNVKGQRGNDVRVYDKR